MRSGGARAVRVLAALVLLVVLAGAVSPTPAAPPIVPTASLTAAAPPTVPSASLTLAEALARARAAHPSLRSAAAEVEAARGRVAQARLLIANPVLSGDLARHSAPGEEQMDRGVELGQELEIGGQRGLRIAAAGHGLAHAERLLADRWRSVAAEVRRAFAGLAAADRRRALAAESAGLATRLVETARRRARAGDVGDLDVKLATIEEAGAEQAVAVAEIDRLRAAARLAAAVGADATETIGVVEQESAPEATAGENDLVARSLAGRPDLAAVRAEQARLTTEADLVRRQAQVPNVTLRGFYREELLDEHIAGGGLSVPLPVWNREQGTESALRAAASGAAAEVSRLEREIPRQVHVAVARHAAASAAWARYARDVLPAADDAGRLVERGYADGYLGLPDVLTQRDRLLRVRSAAIGAWLDLREAEADLTEAVGEEVP